jgi:hypothetical protein
MRENASSLSLEGNALSGGRRSRRICQSFAAGYDSIGITSTSFEASGDQAVDQGHVVLRMRDPKTKEATRSRATTW